MQVLILAAGFGSRLGKPFPKPLTELVDGQTILRRQVASIRKHLPQATVTAIVGFKKSMILESEPTIAFAYNPDFGETNTSKSLLQGLRIVGPGPALWLNGDVVFDDAVMARVATSIEADKSFAVVNNAATGDEEIKYVLNDAGHVTAISKQVSPAMGEAVGINFVSTQDRMLLEKWLDACAEDDYFERALELAIEHDQMALQVLNVSDLLCEEIDFTEDLEGVNQRLREQP